MLKQPVIRFMIGSGLGLFFLLSFQLEQWKNWFIGGVLVIIVFGFIGLMTTPRTHTTTPPVSTRSIDPDTIKRYTIEMLREIRVDTTSGRIEINQNLEEAVETFIRNIFS